MEDNQTISTMRNSQRVLFSHEVQHGVYNQPFSYQTIAAVGKEH